MKREHFVYNTRESVILSFSSYLLLSLSHVNMLKRLTYLSSLIRLFMYKQRYIQVYKYQLYHSSDNNLYLLTYCPSNKASEMQIDYNINLVYNHVPILKITFDA